MKVNNRKSYLYCRNRSYYKLKASLSQATYVSSLKNLQRWLYNSVIIQLCLEYTQSRCRVFLPYLPSRLCQIEVQS